jgi:hypothetical protein
MARHADAFELVEGTGLGGTSAEHRDLRMLASALESLSLSEGDAKLFAT